MIGQFAACDQFNYGDVLYPIVFERMVASQVGVGPIDVLGLIPGKAPGGGRFEVASINKFLSDRAFPLDSLIIGGGDVLQESKPIIGHYSRVWSRNSEPSFIEKVKSRMFARVDPAVRFTKKFVRYDAVGPFLINRRKFLNISRLFYISCGAPYHFSAGHKAEVRDALDSADFIYVRDRLTEAKLIDAGVRSRIHVAPDLLVTLGDFFDLEAERKSGRKILRQWKVNVDRPILCFQANASYWKGQEKTIVKELTAYKKRTHSEVILLPLGYCHDDHSSLADLSKQSSGELKYIGASSIYEMLSVLAACDIFIGTSMHGNITAFSFGIPHLVGPSGHAKVSGFLDIVDLPGDMELQSWSEIGEKLNRLAEYGRELIVSRADAAKLKVRETFARFAKELVRVEQR